MKSRMADCEWRIVPAGAGRRREARVGDSVKLLRRVAPRSDRGKKRGEAGVARLNGDSERSEECTASSGVHAWILHFVQSHRQWEGSLRLPRAFRCGDLRAMGFTA